MVTCIALEVYPTFDNKKPQARLMTSGNEHVWVKMNRFKDKLCLDGPQYGFHKILLLPCFLLIFLLRPLPLLLLLLKLLLLVLFLCFVCFWVLLLNLVLFGDRGARAEKGYEKLGRCILWKLAESMKEKLKLKKNVLAFADMVDREKRKFCINTHCLLTCHLY